MLVSVDRGDRVKVRSISFEGNEVYKPKRLRKQIKNTRLEFPGRFWKRSKYIEAWTNNVYDSLIGMPQSKEVNAR